MRRRAGSSAKKIGGPDFGRGGDQCMESAGDLGALDAGRVSAGQSAGSEEGGVTHPDS